METTNQNELKKISSIWSPQAGPQMEAICATWCDELLYGGAAGGGKSDFLLGDFLQDVFRYESAWRGVLFRRTMGELEEIIARSHELFPKSGATYSIQKSTWKWPNGANLKLRYVERKEDLHRYQGHQYSWIGYDELTHWNDPVFFTYLRSRLRVASMNIPTKRMRATANPGGVGHHWVKAMFIDHAPKGFVPKRDPITEHIQMFIPSKVQDNKILMENDPTYVNRLRGTGSPELVRALLDGDWNVVQGAYFSNFDINTHVIDPFEIPEHWVKIRGFDWGSAKPFACYWGAVSDGEIEGIAKGAIVIYREYYGCVSGKVNTGLKLPSAEVSRGILARQRRGEKIHISHADPAIFHRTDGESIGERMAREGVIFDKADNDRMSGWDEVHGRLNGDADGNPMLLIFANCHNLIRTLPILQHDTAKPEDLDSDGEDHAADALRYLLMSRPYVKKRLVAKSTEIKPLNKTTYQELLDWIPKRRRRR